MTFRKFKKLGSAAGGQDKTMKNNLMADEVSGFLYCYVLSALRSDWVAIVEVFYPDGSWNILTSICLVKHTNTSEKSTSNSGNMCNATTPAVQSEDARQPPHRPTTFFHPTTGADHR